MTVCLPMRAAHHPAPAPGLHRATTTLVGVTTSCPSGLMRVLDAVLVTGGVPTQIAVRRAAASFRFSVVVADSAASPDRLRNRIAQIVGVRVVAARA
ncbi:MULTISPECIES: hypothetical protein [unclassified Sphingomonas]|jgi:hypothetical protein|uniref:hypothetical protein n=1 Tax=unclassified Sphingomonas TaxID=196159 RepID=UPI000F745DDF|nr:MULTISPECIES: hypothetical protein [unclassified Sphingomonas]